MDERRAENPPPVTNPDVLDKLLHDNRRSVFLIKYLELLAQQTEGSTAKALKDDLEATKGFLKPPTVLRVDSLISLLTQGRDPSNHCNNPVLSAETEYGPLNLNTNTGVALSPLTGAAVKLTPYRVLILAELMREPEEVFSLGHLYTLRWGKKPSNPTVELTAIRTHISHLRRDLGEKTDDRRIIYTLQGYGYSLRRLPKFDQIIEAIPHTYDSQVIVIDAVLGKAAFYPDRGKILYQGREITLTPIEARIFWGLTEHPAWVLKPSDVGLNSLLIRAHVNRLRRKFGPELGRIIKTRPGLGYYLNL